MTLKIPNKAQGAFQENMDGQNKIQLPFPAPPFYVLNGDANFEELGGVQYFGGFGASEQNVKAASEQWENCPYPIPGFQEKELKQDGKKIRSIVSRSVVVAPIGMRLFSTIKGEDGKIRRFPPFTKKARPSIQVIAYLGYLNENKQITPWAPIMLTAKGFQVNHISDAFRNWKKAITPFMADIAPGMPSSITNLFWMNIGTFGPNPKFEPHGESSITPVGAFIPDDLDAKKVENRYVGESVAEFMADLASQSQDWISAYNKPGSDVQDDEPVAGNGSYEPDLPPEDDIPF